MPLQLSRTNRSTQCYLFCIPITFMAITCQGRRYPLPYHLWEMKLYTILVIIYKLSRYFLLHFLTTHAFLPLSLALSPCLPSLSRSPSLSLLFPSTPPSLSLLHLHLSSPIPCLSIPLLLPSSLPTFVPPFFLHSLPPFLLSFLITVVCTFR